MEFQSSVAEGPADPTAAQRPYLAVESVVMGALILFCSNRRPSGFYFKSCLSFFSIHVTVRALNVMFRADPCSIMAHIYLIGVIFHSNWNIDILCPSESLCHMVPTISYIILCIASRMHARVCTHVISLLFHVLTMVIFPLSSLSQDYS